MIPGIVDLIFLRLIIPFVLFAVTVVRYNAFSFTYLLFLLACPLLARPKCPQSTTKVQVYLILLITLSCVFTLSHPTLHIVLTVAPPYENALRTCQETMIAAQIGVQRLDGMLPYRAMRLVLPDILILSVAVASLVYFSRRRRVPPALLTSTGVLSAADNSLVSRNPTEAEDNNARLFKTKVVQSSFLSTQKFSVRKNRRQDKTYFIFTRSWNESQRKLWRAWAMDSLRMLTTVLLVCFAGITSPSLPSGVYVLSFLTICTYWACRNDVSPTPFASLRIFLLVYSGLHVCLYYLYQFPFFQEFCKDGGFLARLLGLYYIMRTSCERPGEIIFPTGFRIVDCLAPPITMLLYYILVLETRRWLDSEPSGFSHTLRHNNVSNSEPPVELWCSGNDEKVDDVNIVTNIEGSTSHRVSFNPPVSSSNLCSGKFATAITALSTECRDEDIKLKSQSSLGTGYCEPHADQKLTEEKDSVLLNANPNGEKTSATKQHQKSEDKHTAAMLSPPVGPHFDALFGLPPPFATYMYGWSGNNVATERPFLLSLHYSAIRNSYILTLIAMMAWAVVYRSWLSFILLLSACILWIVPNSRTACLYSSPLIVLYAIVLILIQYIYGLNLTSDELPQEVTPDGLQLSELGMQRSEHSVGALALQMGFLICFWLTLRLFVMERAAKRLNGRRQRVNAKSADLQINSSPLSSFSTPRSLPTILRFHRRPDKTNSNNISLTPFLSLPDDSETPTVFNASAFGPAASFGTVDNNVYRKFTEFTHSLCVKYWIVVCCMSMLLVSVQQPVVVFRIVYMVMLIYFMFIFQISYSAWRRQMLCFWWFIVVYSMAMLLCIYTFQFNESPSFWQHKLGLSSEILKAFGLETFESAALFERLLTPVVFLVVIILQVHYFHIPFLEASALDRFRLPQVSKGSVYSRSGLSDDQNSVMSVSPSSTMSNFIEDVNSAFQIVVSKLYCWAVSLTNHCWRFLEIHWIKIVGLVIILTCTNEVSAANIISLIFLVICFPFPYLHGFMATVVFIWTSVQILCKMTFQLNAVNLNLSSSCSLKYDNATAWDLTAWIGLKKVENFGQYIMPYGALMVVSVIWHAITYRQRQFYNSDRNTRPDEGIVFPGVTINSMGYDLLNVVKFAFNYGFYKFGLELCHCVTVVTACSRVDAFSVLYLLLMLVFLFSPRRLCARLWVSYMVILAVLIPIQYGCCLGLPPGLCVKYPWYTESVEVNNLLQWLYLPSEFGVPSAYKLTADFFQFVVVALQFRIFKIEQQPAAEKLGGGSNRPILTDELPTEGDRDFVSTKESYLDYMRHLIFYWSYWVSLAVVLVTGVVWITLFCLGYMILSFIYLWMGLNVMLRKRTNLINSWNVIIGYNFCVILAKCSLQLMGCVYWSRMADRCWLIQLFGVQCMNPMSWNHFQLPIGYETSCAAVSSGLHWDVICFIFILFQRKVFTSHSFSHVFLDLQVQSQFASRGAYLINRKLMLAIHEQAMEEQYNLTKVQQKINRIQQRQEAFGRSNANVTEHYIMLRSGDYYLFEGDPEEDDDFVNRETHIIGHDSDHSDKDDASPPPSMMRMRESKNNLKCPRSTVSEEPEKQLTTPSATVMNSRTSKSQVTLVPRGKNYLRDVWPSIDPNVLDILSNYTDPYSTIRNERRRGRPSSQGRSALESEQHREQPQFPDMYEDFTNPGPALGHRRMRSHPEFLRRHFAGHQKNINSVVPIQSSEHNAFAPNSSALRSTQTSPSPFNEQITYRTAERRDLNGPPIRHRPHETHRRLFSASEAIFSSKDRPSSPEKCTIVKNAIRSHRRPTKISLSKSSPPKALGPSTAHGITQSQSSSYANKTSNIDLDCMDDSGKALTVTNGGESKRNDVMFPETISHNTIGVTSQIHTPLIADQNAFSYTYFDDGQEADRDSDEEDDANPPSTPNTRLNPIQLLNRAMELGALSAVKQYRRSLHAHSQGLRQREQVDASQPHVLLGSQEGSVIDEMMPTSSSMQQVVVHPFPHKLPKDKSYYHPEFRRKFTQFPSKSGLRKFSVPDIHSCSKSPGVHFSRRLIKQSDSPLVDQEVESSEHCYTTPPQDYLGQPSVSGYNYINSKTGSDDHQRITMSGRVAGRDLVHSLILPSSGTDMLDSKFRSSEGIKYSSKDKNDFHDSENTKRKCDSTQNPAFNVCKPTQHFEPNNNLNESSHFPIFTVRDGQDGEENDQIIKHVNREKSILPAHSSQQLGDNSSPCDLNDNQPANTQGKTRRHSVHEHAESCWSKFKASCLIAYMFFLSSVDSLIRFLNGLTRQYRRIRRTIDQEKRLVKRRVISNIPFTSEQSSELSYYWVKDFADKPDSSQSSRFDPSRFRFRITSPSNRGLIVSPHSNSHKFKQEDNNSHPSLAVCETSKSALRSTHLRTVKSKRNRLGKLSKLKDCISSKLGCCRSLSSHLSYLYPEFLSEESMTNQVQLEAAVLEIISTTPERQLSLFNRQFFGSDLESSKRLSQISDSVLRSHSVENLENVDHQDHEREKAFRQSRSYGFLLLIAVGNLAIVYSELFCYFLLILNHMRSSSLLSLPYPLMVLLWGMLSVPRPTKTFWIFLITYTEIVIVIKYIFQFKFFYFNDAALRPTESSEPLWLPRILGVDKNDDYAVFDLVQLISLFLHRGYLKNNGLWRDHTEFTHDLELIVEENKAAAQLSHSKHGSSVRKTISPGPCLNKSKVDDGLHTSTYNLSYIQQYPQAPHYSLPSGKTWNPLSKLRRFYLKMTDPRYNKKVDVYIYMFLCEFVAFWIMILGYVSFGPSTGMGDNALEFLKSNRIPLPFISMLLVQFIFIIIDRGLFLQKHVLGKFIFQIIHVVLIHGWLFFILPNITRTPFTSGLAPQLLYLIKCVYFSLSAYQIRSGYPRRILGNFLTKNYNYINLVLFKGYLLIPFLYELRNVMDWMWTSSALSLYHWMELEDVYSKIFILKCWRRSELAYPTPRGQNRDASKKALTGGLLLAFFFICFWGPMALTSFIGATFDVNPPVLCSFSFSFGGFPPTFEFTSREGNIFTVNASALSNFIRCHEKDKQTFGFLHNFEWNDLRYVTIDGFSGNIWAITPPSYQALMKKLSSPDSDLLLHFHMKCRRSTKEIQSSHTSVEDIFSRKLTPEEKLQLLMVVNSTDSIFPSSDLVQKTLMNNSHSMPLNGFITKLPESTTDSVTLNAVLPRYVLLKKDRLRGAYAFFGSQNTYVNVSFYIHQDQMRRQAWWELREKVVSPSSDPCFDVIRHPTLSSNAIDAQVLSIITFNERVSDSLFGKVFNNYGIIGMYAAYIFLASRLLRTMYSNISYVIRLEELPHVDRILNLCHEIYLVRENNLLLLEEQLVAKLFFLYRSSETMIKWTRHPKHIVERFTSKPTTPRDTNDNRTQANSSSRGLGANSSSNGETRYRNNRSTNKPLVQSICLHNSTDGTTSHSHQDSRSRSTNPRVQWPRADSLIAEEGPNVLKSHQ